MGLRQTSPVINILVSFCIYNPLDAAFRRAPVASTPTPTFNQG